jgi:hypothetical protein
MELKEEEKLAGKPAVSGLAEEWGKVSCLLDTARSTLSWQCSHGEQTSPFPADWQPQA